MVRIKTKEDIYDSYISAITLRDENFVYFKSGNIRIDLLDKLKKKSEGAGNKFDVSGGKITGNVNVDGSIQSTGTIHAPTNRYMRDGGAINMNNSDIINANCIYMSDESETKEGICFLKQAGDKANQDDYEILRGYRGKVYYEDKVLSFEDNVVKNALSAISNCNDRSLKTGFYYCNASTANMPMLDTGGFLLVMKANDTNITQIFFRYRNNQIWERHYNTVSSTSWKAWEQLH